METMNTNAISSSFLNRLPYWSELEKLSKDDKIKLIAMLSLSIADGDRIKPSRDKSKALKLEQAMELLDTMMVKGGKPVPADEDGKGTLAQIKYCL